MRWYARTLDGWRGELGRAGLDALEVRAPRAADGTALSLLLICG